jgi:hypothetical protein
VGNGNWEMGTGKWGMGEEKRREEKPEGLALL